MNLHIIKKFSILLIAVYFITTISQLFQPATALTVNSISETVDISQIFVAKTVLEYNIGEYTIKKIALDDLKTRCDVISSRISCSPSKVGNNIIYTIKTELNPLVESVNIDNTKNRVSINFGFSYNPLQFIVSQGLNAITRTLTIDFGSHKMIIENPRNLPVTAEYTVTKRFIDNGEISGLASEYYCGDIIKFEKISAPYCVVKINNFQGKSIYLNRFKNCSDIYIPVDCFLNEGDYRITLIIDNNNSFILKESEFTLKPPPSSLFIKTRLSKEEINAGDIIQIYNYISSSYDYCRVSVSDKYGNELVSLKFNLCNSTPISTETSWSSGKYLITVSVYEGDNYAVSKHPVTIKKYGKKNIKQYINKKIVFPGERIDITADSPSEYCITELLDEKYIPYYKSSLSDCRNIVINIDESIPPGRYIVKTSAFEKGSIIATDSDVILLEKWQPPIKTDHDELCENGFFYTDHGKLRCIVDNICIPSSVDLPLCLCFLKNGEISDICNYGETCRSGKCIENKKLTPYIVSVNEGQCIAARGNQQFQCINLGEICNGICLCLDKKYNPISVCNYGEICAPTGCSIPEIQFVTEGFAPNSVPADSFKRGIEFHINGWLRGDRDIIQKFISDKSQNKFLAYIDEIQSHSIKYNIHKNKTVHITAFFRFSDKISPGTHDIYLITGYNKTISVNRYPIKVLYEKDRSDLYVKILKISPDIISLDKLRRGITLSIDTDIRDHDKMVILDLKKDNFKISLGKLKPISLSFSFDRIRETWRLNPTFRAVSLPDTHTLYLSVFELGRYGHDQKDIKLTRERGVIIKIIHISPGNEDEPIYSEFFTAGFDIDIYLNIYSDFQIDSDDFNIFIDNIDISKYISYIKNTDKGIKLRLKNIRICSKTLIHKNRALLTVELDKNNRVFRDNIKLFIQENPGGYDLSEESGCLE